MASKLFERIKSFVKPLAKITYEEKVYKDGHLFIKREVKEGEEAEREIEKHEIELSKAISDFFNNFWGF